MPIYEYICPECQTRREELQRLGEDGQELKCDDCGRVGLEKQFSVFAAGETSGSASMSSGGSCGGGSGFT